MMAGNPTITQSQGYVPLAFDLGGHGTLINSIKNK
jgi:hypothetical protein